MNIEIIIAFSVYFLLLMVIGYFFSRNIKSSADFILGDRSTNYFVSAIALHASDMSHWLFLGFPAVVYATGLIRVWEIAGIVFFMFLNWHFIAPKIREQTEKLKVLTLFSYFEKRFDDTSGIIQTVTALASLVFFTFYISSGLVALGRLFENAFDLPYRAGIFLGMGTTVLYTLIGGFIAVAWCDFFQGLFALAMILMVSLVGLYTIGGWGAIVTAAEQQKVSLSIIPSLGNIKEVLWLFLIWGPGYFGQPQLISFFMGIKNPKKIKYAKAIGFTWQILTLSASALIGLVGLAYFQHDPNIIHEMIFIHLTKLLFSPFFAGIILCAIIAATFSTIDSYILTSGSTVAQDLYKKIIKKDASSKQILFVSRLFSLLSALVALIIAFNENNSIYNLIKYAWSGMGSALGPLVVTSLYSTKANKYGAIAGILTGSVVAAIWPHFNQNTPQIIPGFISSYAAIYLFSALTRNIHK